MCEPFRKVATLRDRWRSPARLVQGVRGNRRRHRYLRGNAGSLRRLLGREAERFGMGPAVVLGQDLAEAAGPVGDGAVADLATGERQLGTVTRKRREGDLLICIYDASPAGVIMP
jgi:hypothetical protein